MSGDRRVRFCGLCKKNVYNFSAMTADQAVALIVRLEGRLCARYYRRRDTSVLTSDCGYRSVARIISDASALALLLLALIFYHFWLGQRALPPRSHPRDRWGV